MLYKWNQMYFSQLFSLNIMIVRSMLIHVAIVHSFHLLSSIPLYEYTAVYLFFCGCTFHWRVSSRRWHGQICISDISLRVEMWRMDFRGWDWCGAVVYKQTLWTLDLFIPLNIIEDPKELLFMWFIFINIYHIIN